MQIRPDRPRVAHEEFEFAVVYGAGASTLRGMPLTCDLTSRALRHLATREGVSGTGMLERITETLGGMLPGTRDTLAKLAGGQDIDRDATEAVNIGELLSLIDERLEQDHWLLGTLNTEDTREVRRALEVGLVLAVGKEMARIFEEGDQVLLPVPASDPMALITTNWDTLLEFSTCATVKREGTTWALRRGYFGGIEGWNPDDSGFGRDPMAPIWLLHLHGAINWVICDVCKRAFFHDADLSGLRLLPGGELPEPRGLCACMLWNRRPFLVAPSLRRSYRHRVLQNCWRAAHRALSRARRWVFIGYSLPIEDIAIRAMLVDADMRRRKRFGQWEHDDWLVLRDDAPGIVGRYRAILPRIRVFPEGVERFTFEGGNGRFPRPDSGTLTRRGPLR